MDNSIKSLALYIHMPWCIKKCPYCDFNSHSTNNNPIQAGRYIESLIKDIRNEMKYLKDRTIHSIFFGGGTPSLFKASELAVLLKFINENFSLSDDCEITMEANPGALDNNEIPEYPNSGINRISIGAQSFNDKHLKILGRVHRVKDIYESLELIRKSDYKSFNIDIMYGLPEQKTHEAIQDLQEALSFSPPHLSWYQLTIEPNTYFYKYKPTLPNEDEILNMERNGYKILEDNHLQRYEISAYGKAMHKCRHNLTYWQYGDYIGIGAGAHSKITYDNKIVRFQKIRQPELYMSKDIKKVNEQIIEDKEQIFEFMLNNLRLLEPIPFERFTRTTGEKPSRIEYQLNEAEKKGLLTKNSISFQLTPLGHRYLNDVTSLFL